MNAPWVVRAEAARVQFEKSSFVESITSVDSSKFPGLTGGSPDHDWSGLIGGGTFGSPSPGNSGGKGGRGPPSANAPSNPPSRRQSSSGWLPLLLLSWGLSSSSFENGGPEGWPVGFEADVSLGAVVVVDAEVDVSLGPVLVATCSPRTTSLAQARSADRTQSC